MASEYFSTNMENGPQVKEALDKINKFYPELFSWIEINDTEIIDLKSPTTNSYIKDPGDYVIYGFSNGPTEIQDTLAPVLLTIRDGKWFVSVNGNIYGLDSSNNWVPFEFLLEDAILFIKGDTAPTKTDKVFWFDTSHYDGTEDQYIDLKYYNTTTNQWESIFENSTDNAYIKKSEFDSTNKQLDVYDYITEKVLDSAGEYADFIRHKNNQLTLIHVTADEREQYAKIITEDELKDLIDNTYMPVLKKLIEDFISDLGTGEAGVAISNLEDDYAAHIANHVTAEDIADWNNKSDANHTHDYTNDDTMKISGSNIVSGIFDNARIPDDIKERYYKLEDTPENVFGNTTITDSDRNSKYHNGNAFYYDTNNETTGEIIRTWYRIIDSTKIGTSEWADGISNFTAKETDLNWENITGHPTNLDEFGITNTLYTKTEIDNNITEYNEYINEATPIIEKYEETSSYTYNRKFTWTERTISNTSRSWQSVCYGNDKFVAVAYSSNYFAYSTDGINWTEGTISKTSRSWYSVCCSNNSAPISYGDATLMIEIFENIPEYNELLTSENEIYTTSNNIITEVTK